MKSRSKNKNNTFYIIGFIILLVFLIAVAYFVLNKKNNKATSNSGNPICYKNGPIATCTKITLNSQQNCNSHNNIPYNIDTKCCNGQQIFQTGTPLKYDLFCLDPTPPPGNPLILIINILKLPQYPFNMNLGFNNSITSVNWGEDNSGVTTDFQHKYSKTGTYSIKIYGSISNLNNLSFLLNPRVDHNFKEIYQIGIDQFGDSYKTLKLISIYETDLIIIPSSLPPNVSQLYFEKVNILPSCDMTNLDVSNIKNMKSMFWSCYDFNQNISGWNVKNVTNMSSMFEGCKSFNQDLSGWDVSSVTDMSSMFYGCESFNKSLNWGDKVSNVTNMSYMFGVCENFNQDISGWNVKNVTDMSFMIEGCKSFNQSLCSWTKKVNINILNRDEYLANQVKICDKTTYPISTKSNYNRNSIGMYYNKKLKI